MRSTSTIAALLLVPCLTVAGEPKPLPNVSHPEDNPSTPEKVALGRKLFFDPMLSRDRTISCATCHDPDKGFADGRKLAVGIDDRTGRRHTPSLTNVGFAKSLMWDGRATSLETQALLPIANPCEMGLALDELMRRLRSDDQYRVAFKRAFDDDPSPDRVARAIASFERTLVLRETPFDRHLAGDNKALDDAAKRGMRLFFGEAKCSTCHSDPLLSDGEFHNVGIVNERDFDEGRAAISKQERDRGAFRTPQLRGVGRTAPYMHDGRFATLEEVVRHYNFGGVTDAENPNRDEQLEVLYLDDESVADLVQFLAKGLTRPKESPERAHSLSTGGRANRSDEGPASRDSPTTHSTACK